ncbi:MAG: hypothetical protein ACYTKD_17480 [Planctomycetota bacterium]|jgi:hypothetical protein
MSDLKRTVISASFGSMEGTGIFVAQPNTDGSYDLRIEHCDSGGTYEIASGRIPASVAADVRRAIAGTVSDQLPVTTGDHVLDGDTIAFFLDLPDGRRVYSSGHTGVPRNPRNSAFLPVAEALGDAFTSEFLRLARRLGPDGDLATLPRAPSGEEAYLAAYAVGRSLEGREPSQVPGLVYYNTWKGALLAEGDSELHRRVGEALRAQGVPETLSRPLPGDFLSGIRYTRVPRGRKPRLELLRPRALAASNIRGMSGAVLFHYIPEQSGFDLPMLVAIARARCPVLTYRALTTMAAHPPKGRPESRQALLDELIRKWRREFPWASGVAPRLRAPGLKE